MEPLDCIFCRIIQKQIKADIVYEDEYSLVFQDIAPQAPIHLLLIPKVHLESVNAIDASNSIYVAKLYELAKQMAYSQGVSQTGYRLVTNTGKGVGQSVFHLHIHLLGGRVMLWPPG